MLKPLIAKEWNQLRLTRLFGIVIGLVLPPGLVLFASLTKTGWLPIAAARDWSTEQLFAEPLQALYVALWVLITLLVGAQLYSSDRGAGTEWFLLERPVKRSTIWIARFLAALATWILTVVAHTVAYVVWNLMWTSHRWQDMGGNLVTMLWISAVLFIIATGSAAVAAGFLRQPTQVALLALVLSLVPLGLIAILINVSPMMRALGLLLPWALPLGYYVASYRMETVPEPAGRGRWRYGLWIVLPLLVAIPVVHFAATPLVQRSMASGRYFQIFANYTSTHAVAMTREHGGWLMDLKAGKSIKFLPPPLTSARWSPDGTRVAIGHMAEPWGGISPEPIVEFFDLAGNSLSRIVCQDCDIWTLTGQAWSDESFLLESSSASRPQEVVVLDTDGTVRGRIPVEEHYLNWELQAGGGAFPPAIVRTRWVTKQPAESHPPYMSVSVDAINVESLTTTPTHPRLKLLSGEMIFKGIAQNPQRAGLSPARSYWITSGSTREIISSATGETIHTAEPVPNNYSLALLDDDQKLVYVRSEKNWHEVELLYGPVDAPEKIASWQRHWVGVFPNPSSRLALVTVSVKRKRDESVQEWEPEREVWLLDGESGEFRQLGTRPGEEISWFGGYPRWVSDTLIQVGPEGGKKLYDVESGEILELEPILPG